MICLTGDVHQAGTGDAYHSRFSEVKIAKKYLEIANKKSLKVTLFFTGRTFEKEWDDIKPLLEYSNLEIGAHTYNALRPTKIHWIFKLLTGSYYGPYLFQKIDVARTLRIITEKTGRNIVSWRTHCYASDKWTYEILPKFGIRVVSDEVKNVPYPRKMDNGLISLPINVLPDHDHIFHGIRTPSYVRKELYPDGLSSESYNVREWLEIVKWQVKNIDEKGGIATLLVHPICMQVIDRLESFKKLCDFLSDYDGIFVRDALRYVK